MPEASNSSSCNSSRNRTSRIPRHACSFLRCYRATAPTNSFFSQQLCADHGLFCVCSFVSIGYTAAAKMFSSTTRVCPSTSNGQIAGFLNPVLASCQLVHVARPGEEPDVWEAQEDMRLLSDELTDKNGEGRSRVWLGGGVMLSVSCWVMSRHQHCHRNNSIYALCARWHVLHSTHDTVAATQGADMRAVTMCIVLLLADLPHATFACVLALRTIMCVCVPLQVTPCLLRSAAAGLTTPPTPAASC